MAKVLHTCTGCVPIDVSIIDVYVALLKMVNAGRGPVGPQGPKGDTGEPAGFGTATATVDNTSGDPGCQVVLSGPDTAKDISFAFSGVVGAKGAKGDKGDKGNTGDTGRTGPMGPPGVSSATVSVGQTTGNPSGTISVDNGVLSLSLSGIKGEQGNTGSSVDYPFELVNSRFGGGAGKAWSAEQGKLLAEAVCYLGQVVETI